jgi:hypothetical protein
MAQGKLASIQTTPIPSNNEAAISARHAPVWKLRAYPPHTPLMTIIAALGWEESVSFSRYPAITWADHACNIAYRISLVCVCFNNSRSFLAQLSWLHQQLTDAFLLRLLVTPSFDLCRNGCKGKPCG